MARKAAELERAMDWNDSQSCLSMRSRRMAIEFSILVLVEDIAAMMIMDRRYWRSSY
jgi:hypothetical protein